MSTIPPDHPYVRPGQVTPDRPAPDQCMVCGEPGASHALPPGWQVFLHSEGSTTSYIVHAPDELTAVARAGQEHEDRIEQAEIEPWTAP